jgi:hypothetical protein
LCWRRSILPSVPVRFKGPGQKKPPSEAKNREGGQQKIPSPLYRQDTVGAARNNRSPAPVLLTYQKISSGFVAKGIATSGSPLTWQVSRVLPTARACPRRVSTSLSPIPRVPGVIKSAVFYAAFATLSQYLFQYPPARSTLRESMIRAFLIVHHAPAVFRRFWIIYRCALSISPEPTGKPCFCAAG